MKCDTPTHRRKEETVAISSKAEEKKKEAKKPEKTAAKAEEARKLAAEKAERERKAAEEAARKRVAEPLARVRRWEVRALRKGKVGKEALPEILRPERLPEPGDMELLIWRTFYRGRRIATPCI